MKTVIGIDYGTQSARAVLADTATGQVLSSHTVRYPHGVMPGDLACAADYENGLDELLCAVTLPAYRDSIVGICVDATSFTLVPMSPDGKILCTLPGFETEPHAHIKLWKRHTAQAQACEALSLAKATSQPFLSRTGGALSCEWMLPKLMEIRDEAPRVWQRLDMALDLCEFLTYRLTGSVTRSTGSMGYKGLWASDLGFPADGYLDMLRPGLGAAYCHLLRGEVLQPGALAGHLSSQWRTRLGLRQSVAVAAGMLDGHTGIAALGAFEPGDAALVLGTSSVLTIQTEALYEIEGITGVVLGGLMPGLYGLEGGQSCTGDMLEWYMQEALPGSLRDEAAARSISPHQLLCERIIRPWESDLIAVDWFNGSRNLPCDLTLSGALWGLTLQTKPETIYLALLQSIVCGTREILEHCAASGVKVNRLLATGGIAKKNPLLMQLYADVLHQDVHAGQHYEGPALGAAIYAAVAAGAYMTLPEACAHMGVKAFTVYRPQSGRQKEYALLYQKNHVARQSLLQARRQLEAIHSV